jgi:ketosteroid isomerase-like protein
MVAAMNRVRDVIDRYAAALNARDKEALAELRSEVSEREQALLDARTVKVAVTVEQVTIEAGAATARCTRTIEGTSGDGAPIRSGGEATFVLARRPAGWVITEIR